MNARLLSPLVTRFLLVIMLCLPVWGNQVSAQTPESYAVLDEATGTLTFRHDTKKPAGAYPLNSPEELPGWFVEDYDYLNGIAVNKNRIEKVVFDASFAAARPTSCRYWFAKCTDLKTIEGIEYLNTENVTNMREMFENCNNLTTLDVSKFNTKNVMDMEFMFGDCKNLTTLKIANFDTQNVTDMSGMFYGCNNLTALDVSNFDTKNVTNMEFMFDGCNNLTVLNVSNFDTKNVKRMDWMFYNCSNLTTIYVSEKFVTTACEISENMFKNCEILVGAVPYDESKTGMEMANYITGYFTDIKTTGINATPISDNIAAKYYDVLGRRMNAPQKGINIVKRGGRTMKVLVK